MSGTWLIEVQKNSKGDLYVEFPPDLLKRVGWKPGDRILWEENKELYGWTLKKAPIKKKRS